MVLTYEPASYISDAHGFEGFSGTVDSGDYMWEVDPVTAALRIGGDHRFDEKIERMIKALEENVGYANCFAS